ncbi:11171_t:CDS:2, partial [Scutellospora calospora]
MNSTSLECMRDRKRQERVVKSKNNVQRLVRLGYHADKLNLKRDKLNNSKRKKKKAKRIDKAEARIYKKIKNLRNELHQKKDQVQYHEKHVDLVIWIIPTESDIQSQRNQSKSYHLRQD